MNCKHPFEKLSRIVHGRMICDLCNQDLAISDWMWDTEKRATDAEEKLAMLEQTGIKISRLEQFEAFTPEAKAAYPVAPKWMITTTASQRDQLMWKVVAAAREDHAVNDDGHECPRDGTECPGCLLKDALTALDKKEDKQ